MGMIVIAAQTPLVIDGVQQVSNKKSVISLTHHLPTAWHVKLQTMDRSGKKPSYAYENYDITLDDAGEVHYTMRLDNTALATTQMQLKNLQVINSDDEKKTVLLHVDALNSKWGAGNGKHFKSALAIERVSGAGLELLAPINLKWSLSYEGISEASDDSGLTTIPSAFKLKEFIFEIPDASVSATANLKASPEDILPTGKALVEIHNLPHIRELLAKNAVIDASDEVFFDAMLKRITGKGLNESQDVGIPIVRERGGAFLIGKITLEEAFTMVLTHRYAGKKAVKKTVPVQKEVTK